MRLLGALVGGLALWLAFPAHKLWWLAPIGVALINLSLVRVRARYGVVLGLLAGWAFFIPTLSWSGVYVGTFPWFALATLETLYFGLMGGVIAALQSRRLAPLSASAAWMTQEWLRSTTPFGGFPWARLAFSQADALWSPLVAWVGSPGLSFLVAALGGTVAAVPLVVDARVLKRAPSLTKVTVAAAVSPVALLLTPLVPKPGAGIDITVAAVQGNVPKAGLDFNAQREAVLRNHLTATQQLAADVNAGKTPRPDLVVLPENASDIDPTIYADADLGIRAATDAVKAPLVIGAVLKGPGVKVSNTSLLYLPGRGIVDRYTKQHPVPFGEYIPYRSFFRQFSTKVDLVRADFAAGSSVGLFDISTPHGRVKAAPIICFEVAYDDLMRKPANEGAELFLVQTNNATFGYTAESAQQLAISRIRAQEYGRSIVHVSTVGVSALISPDGSAHQMTRMFTQEVISGQVRLRSKATLAQRLGRWPEMLGAAWVVMALGFTAANRRKIRKSSDAAVR